MAALQPLKFASRGEPFELAKARLQGACLTDVADRANVAVSTLHRWRDDVTREPRLSTVVKVLRAMGYHLEAVPDRS